MRMPESHPDFPALEAKMLDWWEKEKVVDLYLHRNDKSDKKFAFLDGPITANNPMGVHHAHGRTIKDFYQRYKNMRGFKQRFQNGFDCQGLWVEVEEEKDLGFNSKKDIENYGIDKFCQSCRTRVSKYSQIQSQQSQRLGMFMDWEKSYYTMSEVNNLHIWHFLKEIDRKGWLYKGVDAMPWCARCGTAISQHELSDGGYKDVTHESVYVVFNLTETAANLIQTEYKLAKANKISLFIWTTTPWTLLANVGVALNPNHDYVIVRLGNEYLILAKKRLDVLKHDYNVVAEFKGQKLIEMFSDWSESVYTGPFDELDSPAKVTHRLLGWEEVAEDDGTGMVHIAPGAGKEDFDLGREQGLDMLAPIDEFGNYVAGYGDYTGRNVTEIRKMVYESLKEKQLFYRTESIHHSYPHCWRCKEPLVFRTTSEWFIRADEIRPLIKAAAESVNWIPEYAGKRMQDWLDNMGDWPISRKRYWGLALPFYESDDGSEYYVVGSKEELKNLAVDPEMLDSLPELHRPWVDKIKIKSPQTGNVLTRVSDVGDCWLDAGIVPFSTVDYLNDKDQWAEWFPFEFITEYVAQIKLWFYSTLFMSVTLENQAPWKTVLSTGFLVDEKGEHMHKSKGNAIAFDEAAEKAGADAIRWLYLRERSANHHGTGNLRFGYNILSDVRRRFFVILWNSYRFIVQNMILDGWDAQTHLPEHESSNVLDQWIKSRLNQILKIAENSVDHYDSTEAALEIERFVVNDFSQWYIRQSRDRVGPTATDQSEKENFYQTSYNVLLKLVQAMAPFTPFLSEEIYQNLRRDIDPISVHLCDWPMPDDAKINKEIEILMQEIRLDAEQVHSIRKTQGIPLRQPLQKLTTVSYPAQFNQILMHEVNVKEINGTLTDVDENTRHQVILDQTLTENLILEGKAREFVRKVQSVRRDAGYEFDQKINVKIKTSADDLKDAIAMFEDEIVKKLMANKIIFCKDEEDVKGDIQTNVQVENNIDDGISEVEITLQKL